MLIIKRVITSNRQHLLSLLLYLPDEDKTCHLMQHAQRSALCRVTSQLRQSKTVLLSRVSLYDRVPSHIGGRWTTIHRAKHMASSSSLVWWGGWREYKGRIRKRETGCVVSYIQTDRCKDKRRHRNIGCDGMRTSRVCYMSVTLAPCTWPKWPCFRHNVYSMSLLQCYDHALK